MENNFKRINSVTNDKITYFYKLKNKKYILKNNLFLIEGKNIIAEAIKKNLVSTILIINQNEYQDFKGEKIIVNQKIIDKLSFNKNSNNAIAICKLEDNLFLDNDLLFNKIIILDKIQDPKNLGSIVRTAYGLGFEAIYLTDQTVFPYNHYVISSSQGAIFLLPIFYLRNFNFLKNYQKYLFVIDKNATKLSEIKKSDEKIALIFGNEGNGISTDFFNIDQKTVKTYIPLVNNFDSFNVSIAAAIALYYFQIIIKK